jgi:hypothetical protein
MSTALEAYLTEVDQAATPALTRLDHVITRTYPDFAVAVRYRLLMYAVGNDWRHWVCAISPTKRGVSLRFLYGVMMSDPRRVLRGGTANLMSWDFGRDEAIDEAGVREYVAEAVALYPQFRANAKEVNEAARAAAQERGRPRRPRS